MSVLDEKEMMDENSYDSKRRQPILRRIIIENDGSTAPAQQQHSEHSKLFEPLFGEQQMEPCNEKGKAAGAAGSTLSNKTSRDTTSISKKSFKITLAYRGSDFCGWLIQRHTGDNPSPKKPAVQQVLQEILDPVMKPVLFRNKAQSSKKRQKPPDIRVCGRTDAGVSAIAQVCRVRTFRGTNPLVNEEQIRRAINLNPLALNDRSLRCLAVETVDEGFHPTFSATCRAYAYLIDIADEAGDHTGLSPCNIPYLNSMLKQLEGVKLDYVACSYGKVKTTSTFCTLYHARASLVELVAPALPPPTSTAKDVKCNSNRGNRNNDQEQRKKRAVCIELVGDRFLRRMVRILVSTAVREALLFVGENGFQKDDDSKSSKLLDILQTRNRNLSAKAAPANGLIFIGAAFRREEE